MEGKTAMTSKSIITPNFCVIGAGSGGLSFAAGAAQMGASVVILERNKMGGDCLNYGCVPSKALIAASKIGYDLKKADNFGWDVLKSSVEFKRVHDHVHEVISKIAPNDSVERFEKLGAKVILEEGRFLDEHTIETNSYLIKAKRFIVSTGSTPFLPLIEGLKDVPFYTNESIFDIKELPNHLVIIGSGPLGIEMAQAFRRLGSRVTVLGSSSILQRDDPEMTSKLRKILLSEGIEIREHVQIKSVRKKEVGLELVYTNAQGNTSESMASHILVAAGRKPNIENLNLDLAHVKFLPQGINVNANLQTSNRKIYAIGDCTGGHQFTHVAGYHASLALRNTIFRLGTKVETRATPWVTYTDPELAHVGFYEEHLQSQNIPYKVLQMNFDENDRAQAEKRTEGAIKVLVSPKGYVLGASIIGIHAGELIYPWIIAIQNKLKISAIASAIPPYPTLSEINKRVAGQFYADKIFSSSMKKIVKCIMRITR